MATGTLTDAQHVAQMLHSNGFLAYLCGGCVRDMLTGHTPKDFDIATDATSDQVIKIFPEADLVGKSFGVVIANGIDVATFRKDGTYTDGRRPDSVEYTTDLQDDSNRRDFTCNALFMHPFTHEILDFHGGQADIAAKFLRAVGNPDDRFQQDYLRMLRAIRFASKLGFAIHTETYDSIVRNAQFIADMDVERLHDELVKAFAHNAPLTLMNLLGTGMLAYIFPEVVVSDVTSTVVGVPQNVSPALGLSSILFKLSVPQIKALGKRLKFSNDEIDGIVNIVDLQDRIAGTMSGTTVAQLKRLMRSNGFLEALQLFMYRVAGHDASFIPFQFVSDAFSRLKDDLSPARLVTGDDLIALGMRPSKEFAAILNAVEDAQLNGQVNTKDEALTLAQRLMKN